MTDMVDNEELQENPEEIKQKNSTPLLHAYHCKNAIRIRSGVYAVPTQRNSLEKEQYILYVDPGWVKQNAAIDVYKYVVQKGGSTKLDYLPWGVVSDWLRTELPTIEFKLETSGGSNPYFVRSNSNNNTSVDTYWIEGYFEDRITGARSISWLYAMRDGTNKVATEIKAGTLEYARQRLMVKLTAIVFGFGGDLYNLLADSEDDDPNSAQKAAILVRISQVADCFKMLGKPRPDMTNITMAKTYDELVHEGKRLKLELARLFADSKLTSISKADLEEKNVDDLIDLVKQHA